MAKRKAKVAKKSKARKARVAKKRSTARKRTARVAKKRPAARGKRTLPAPGIPSIAGPARGGPQWPPKAGEVGIRVRMYRVGFGHFFFLTYLQGAGEPVHIVIDCGVFKGTSQTGDIGSIEAAVADMV